MKYKIKCTYGTYNVDFKSKITIEKYLLFLRCKRIYRALRRLFAENKYLIIPLIFFSIVLGIVAILFYIIKKENIFNILEISNYVEIILTVILLPIATNTFIKESERHQNLIIQYDVYKGLEFESISFIQRLLSNNIDYCMFFNEEKEKKGIKYIYDNFYNRISISNAEFEYYCINYLENIKYQLSRLNIVEGKEEYESSYQYVRNYISDELFKLKNNRVTFNNEYVFDFINRVIGYIYPLLASYRRPWRWDRKIDSKIIEILKEKSECDIGVDFKRDF